MNPGNTRNWRFLIEALARGDKRALAILKQMQDRALGAQVTCTFCGRTERPLMRGHDPDTLDVLFECPECGQINRLPMQDWNLRKPETGN
jgi:predicted RNA-binding Zn-ribbon protein involved in translation (DUF1610 family)